MGGRGMSTGRPRVQTVAEPQPEPEQEPESTPVATPTPTPAPTPQAQQPIKTSKKQQQIIDWVQNQVNVDLNQWRDDFTARVEMKSRVTVYWKDVPTSTKNTIMNLTNQYGGRLQYADTGSWGRSFWMK